MKWRTTASIRIDLLAHNAAEWEAKGFTVIGVVTTVVGGESGTHAALLVRSPEEVKDADET